MALAVILIAGLSGCGMPFEWSGKMPDSWGEGGQDEPAQETPGHENGEEDDPQPGNPGGAHVMTVTGPSFTLAWDPGAGGVASYHVYWREHGKSAWQVLVQHAADPQVTVNEGDLPYGTYEFAVSSVSSEGVESDRHHSFDDSADPEPWILRWIAG